MPSPAQHLELIRLASSNESMAIKLWNDGAKLEDELDAIEASGSIDGLSAFNAKLDQHCKQQEILKLRFSEYDRMFESLKLDFMRQRWVDREPS